MSKWFFLFFALFAVSALQAADGHRIKVKIQNYEEKELYLAYYYGDKQYILDTATVGTDGFFDFAGEKPLESGVYLIVLAPNNTYFQILVDKAEQFFKVYTQKENPSEGVRIENSPENKLFYSYLQFLSDKRPLADTLIAQMGREEDEGAKERFKKELDELNEKVTAHQKKLVADHPTTLTAALIKAGFSIDYPEFEGEEETKQRARWEYTVQHFFDHVNLADQRLLRTPFLFERVEYFVSKLAVQVPDSISVAIDSVLEKMKPAEETYKYYLIHFLNTYAKSNIVGMDAVYVHMVDKYYSNGQTPWVEAEQLKKIIDNAAELKPLLIGKKAPDITMQERSGKSVSLHSIQADFIVLYFWRYDCGHCQKTLPDMKAFYEKYNSQNVKLISVCTKFTDELQKCWEYIDEKEIGNWYHLSDQYHRSRYMTVYAIKSTPTIYILDKNKEIISKRIGPEQLTEVMDKIIEFRNKEKAAEGK